ncbi:hypothetical protein ABIE21_002993 [Conyzicola nivalis]|uniref:SAF domain-containing protein n=1 Tax=Conyzicola nivalis TaxID=1477021 RepID=A0ABV2QSM7_9MICO
MTATMRDGARAGARRRFWFDPRFAIGLLLIVASVAGVVGIVGAADSSVLVYAAREPLAPGDRVDADDLVGTSVRLAGAERLYLVPDDLPDDGLVVTKAVAEGELVPASAVGSTEGERQTSIVVGVSGELAESVEAGSIVDVWSARESTGGVFEAPVVIVSGATVVRLVDRQGLVVDNDSRSIEVLVPRTDVARVLEAIANDDAIAVVPASLPGK